MVGGTGWGVERQERGKTDECMRLKLGSTLTYMFACVHFLVFAVPPRARPRVEITHFIPLLVTRFHATEGPFLPLSAFAAELAAEHGEATATSDWWYIAYDDDGNQAGSNMDPLVDPLVAMGPYPLDHLLSWLQDKAVRGDLLAVPSTAHGVATVTGVDGEDAGGSFPGPETCERPSGRDASVDFFRRLINFCHCVVDPAVAICHPCLLRNDFLAAIIAAVGIGSKNTGTHSCGAA